MGAIGRAFVEVSMGLVDAAGFLDHAIGELLLLLFAVNSLNLIQ